MNWRASGGASTREPARRSAPRRVDPALTIQLTKLALMRLRLTGKTNPNKNAVRNSAIPPRRPNAVNAFSAAARVSATCVGPCAVETNAASNCEGAR